MENEISNNEYQNTTVVASNEKANKHMNTIGTINGSPSGRPTGGREREKIVFGNVFWKAINAFRLRILLLVAFEMELKFSYFSHFCIVGRGGTLTALTQHVSRRMEDLRLWHELSYIEVQ